MRLSRKATESQYERYGGKAENINKETAKQNRVSRTEKEKFKALENEN